ncbi:Gfo/Idh/MocA family protein [Glaciibacter superstes]|uniref:Gfo/Idh/MocA family protein n=1 Tax=Glaciibacter superstes TaxID=501023 RepID=UPI0003B5757B|nr:Gfo/Idh/MocA family oxidoreductase [Glaciibacter superstes]
MNTTSTVKVAIVSFAHSHALSYAYTLAAMPGVEVLAADPDGASAPDLSPRGAELAARIGIDYVDDYDALFAWQPDAVIVASENSRHRELVERAATAGVHVLCEKPLATTVADGRAMVDACARAGVILMLAYPVRFSPSFRALQGLVADDRLGDLFAINGTNNGKLPIDSRRWFADAELAGGGAIVDHVVHCADLIDAITGGSRADSVYAVSNRILHADKDIDVETGGLVTVTYPGGLIATIDCSWSQPDAAATWGGLSLQVTGTGGSALIEPFAEHVAGTGSDGPIHLGYGTNLDELLLTEFIAAVRQSGSPRPGSSPRVVPQPDGSVGLRTLEIMDAARRSAAEGRPVTIAAG